MEPSGLRAAAVPAVTVFPFLELAPNTGALLPLLNQAYSMPGQLVQTLAGDGTGVAANALVRFSAMPICARIFIVFFSLRIRRVRRCRTPPSSNSPPRSILRTSA